jgi:hypothetical protein
MAGSESRNTVYETMTKLRFAKFTVRVWRDCTPSPQESPMTDFMMGPDSEIEKVGKLLEKTGQAGEPQLIIRGIYSLPRIAAIEILTPEGNGGLFYPDWK